MSSVIIYCCCVRSVRSYGVAKNTLSVTNQPAADYETPVKSSGLEMKDNMAYGHVSVTTSTGTPAVVYESVQS